MEGDGGALLGGAAGAVGHRDPDDGLAVHDEAGDGRFLADMGALFAGVIEHHLVELGAQHLPGLRDRVLVVAIEKIERLGAATLGLDEAHAVFFHEVRALHFRDHPEALERLEGERDEGFADVVAGEFLALEDEHAVTVFGEEGPGGRAGGTGPDDDSVVVFGGGRG